MRFTDFQTVLFINGYTFCHIAPTDERLRQAISDFQDSISGIGSWSRHWQRFTNDRTLTSVTFKLGVVDGSSSEHVSVLFLDGKKSEFTSERYYEEALYIPMEINGLGPLTVR